MRDRQTEAQYYPREFLPLQDLDDLLCIAPHPDDEVFGAGGLLALLAAQGRRVRCLVLSRGERAEGDPSGELAALRMDESRRAARERRIEPGEGARQVLVHPLRRLAAARSGKAHRVEAREAGVLLR